MLNYRNYGAKQRSLPLVAKRTMVVVNILRRINGKGEEFYTIEMVDADTGYYYKTYASEVNRNFVYWENIIVCYDENTGPVIEGSFAIKKCKSTMQPIIIDADCIPRYNGVNVDRLDYLRAYYNHYLA